MTLAKMPPDPWQARFLAEKRHRTLLLASRQSGKSQTVSAKVLAEALNVPKSLILLLSPTLRQSGELFREKLLPLWRAAGQPLMREKPTQLELRLANGSRIVSLPQSEGNIRGYSGVTHLVVDEAARVSDTLYKAVRPFLAVRNGALTALSTPFGQQGWFYEAWHGVSKWERIKVTAAQCPRISPEFLAEELLDLGQQFFDQEYNVEFTSMEGAEWDADYFSGLWCEPPVGIRWASQVPNGILSIDTSHGKKNSDAQALVHCNYAMSGEVYVDAEAVRLDDEKLFQRAISTIERHRPHAVVVEVNEAGFVLFNRLKRHLVNGALINVYGRHHSENKHARIRGRLTPYWSRKLLRFERTPGNQLLVREAQAFPLGTDDLLDALEQNIELAANFSLPPERRTTRYER